MGLTRHVIQRLLLMVPMLIGITLVTFIVTHLVPSNPLNMLLNERAMEYPDVVEATIEKWGLDKPLYEQYFVYLVNLAKGEFGVSFRTQRAVAQDLAVYLPATMELGLAAMLFALVVGLPLGVVAALRSGKWLDHVARIVSLLGASVPPFWSGLVALYLLYFRMGILPGPGRIDTRMLAPANVTGLYLIDTVLAGNAVAFSNVVSHLVLPSMILGWFTLALVSRITRSSLLEALGSDYVRTAHAKGLRPFTVVVRHALRNALIPTVTVGGLAFAGLVAGAIMTETIFSWPGIGMYAVESAINLDFPAVMGVTIVIAVAYMVSNLVVDVLYGVLDPRIRET